LQMLYVLVPTVSWCLWNMTKNRMFSDQGKGRKYMDKLANDK
jgi:hypothetical protein